MSPRVILVDTVGSHFSCYPGIQSFKYIGKERPSLFIQGGTLAHPVPEVDPHATHILCL